MNRAIIFAYLRLMRIPAVFTAMSNILAAHIIATQGEFQWLLLVQLLIISSMLYLAGMILNDCFDLEEDKRERPSRPLPSGEISTLHAWILGWLFLLTAILVAVNTNATIFSITVALTVFIISYNAYLKRTALASLTMASCRYLNWLLGLTAANMSLIHFLIPLPIFIYIDSLTRVSRIETTAETKLPIMLCVFSLLLTSAIITILYFLSIYTNPWLFAVLIPVTAIGIAKVVSIYKNFNSKKVQGLVKFLILGIIPLDALIVLADGSSSWWGPLLILLLLIPSRWFAHIIPIT